MSWKLREQDKHFLWSLYSAISVIFIWKGIWEGIYEIPYFSDYFGNPFVFLFIGFAMLTFSGIIFNEFDPLGGLEKSISKVLREVHQHPKKKHYKIRYYDKKLKKEIAIDARHLKGIEKQSLIVKHPKQKKEMFIPFHRLKDIRYKGKTYWRL